MEEMVSAHFSRKEMACPHCGECVLDPNLTIALEQLRSQGPEPIIVHDAYRCPVHNAAVGGVRDSEHENGKAADIEIVGLSLREMYYRALHVPLFIRGGIGIYDGKPFLHVDVRNGKARWARVNGQYVDMGHLLNIS